MAYADRIGRWHLARTAQSQRRELAQYLTPVRVARFMASLCSPAATGRLRVLDPGAGSGVLACAVCERVAAGRPRGLDLELEAYEADPALAECLLASLSHAKEWLLQRGATLHFAVRVDDFVMAHADALEDAGGLLGARGKAPEAFDIVVCNPPYFKIPKSDPRAQAAASVVCGQPNIYALFMAVSASLLRPMGKLVFITPRSYAAGPYFRRFRERFFAMVRPEAIHLFESREATFCRDEVLQENVILCARREDGWARRPGRHQVMVSSSYGARDIEAPKQRVAQLGQVLDLSGGDFVLRIPASEADDLAARTVQSWTGRLNHYGLRVSTGPIVAFRARALLAQRGCVPGPHAPLLWMHNIAAMKVRWPVAARSKSQYVAVRPESVGLLIPDGTYVLVRRFSAKEEPRRLVAAPLLAGTLRAPWIGLENHLNYIYRPGGFMTANEAWGLAVVLNSSLLDTYFRSINGNTQVNAAELMAMPLPPLAEIVEIGRRASERSAAVDDPAGIVEEVLGVPSNPEPGVEAASV